MTRWVAFSPFESIEQSEKYTQKNNIDDICIYLCTEIVHLTCLDLTLFYNAVLYKSQTEPWIEFKWEVCKKYNIHMIMYLYSVQWKISCND